MPVVVAPFEALVVEVLSLLAVALPVVLPVLTEPTGFVDGVVAVVTDCALTLVANRAANARAAKNVFFMVEEIRC